MRTVLLLCLVLVGLSAEARWFKKRRYYQCPQECSGQTYIYSNGRYIIYSNGSSYSHSSPSTTSSPTGRRAEPRRQMTAPPDEWVEDGRQNAPSESEMAQLDKNPPKRDESSTSSADSPRKTDPTKKSKTSSTERWQAAVGGGHYFTDGKGNRWFVDASVTYKELLAGSYDFSKLAYVDPKTNRLFYYATRSMGANPSYYFGPREGGAGIALQTNGSIHTVQNFGAQLGSLARYSANPPALE